MRRRDDGGEAAKRQKWRRTAEADANKAAAYSRGGKEKEDGKVCHRRG